MKTIGHILPFPAVGGTEHATVRIAMSVDPSKLRNVMFYPSGADEVRHFLQRSGLAAIPYDPPVPSYRHGIRYTVSSWKLAKRLRESKVDLVHCADLLAAHYGGLAGKLAGLRVISHIRARFDDLSLRDCSFLWPVDSFIFVSSNTREHFACSIAKRRGIVVYDGIDPAPRNNPIAERDNVRREFGMSSSAPVVGMVARIAPVKDYLTLAKAARRVLDSQPDTRFLLVGDCNSGDAREHYPQVINALRRNNVEHAFVFTGHREDVSRIFSGIDVFVLSTHLEGLPLVILEAMAHGKPVVATAVGGIPELVTDGETGLLFAHGNDVQLAQHILRLFESNDLCGRLVSNGMRRLETEFSHRRFADGINAVYARALQLRTIQ